MLTHRFKVKEFVDPVFVWKRKSYPRPTALPVVEVVVGALKKSIALLTIVIARVITFKSKPNIKSEGLTVAANRRISSNLKGLLGVCTLTCRDMSIHNRKPRRFIATVIGLHADNFSKVVLSTAPLCNHFSVACRAKLILSIHDLLFFSR